MKGIQIQGVEKSFSKRKILQELDFTFEAHKIYGLLGRNGAGKSTLLNIITDRIFATSGQVIVDGEVAKNNDAALSKIYLSSEMNAYPASIRLEKIFKMTELFYGDFDYTLANNLAKQFDLDLQQKFGKLSTGYRNIFKFIVALGVPAEYIFLDEPTLGLDANHRDLLYQSLSTSYIERPRTFVIATHLIGEVASLLERVVVIDQGQVIINGDLEDVLEQSYLISGPEKEVSEYTKNLNVIGKERLGKISSYYVYGKLDDECFLPDVVTIEHLDLQQLFIHLTNPRKEQ
ncbi:ABC transporter ATP-binding protein [Ligilactobacillus sp. WILCCON 0076]|uniref:ABC transporter ATP-binding protein n=1 Tax=Ligilactobacillus ubinensis TaxID=2876789 RepID=A0A9X2FJJ8_9LACO|nr:ABC transporter ATP-binding protein [Ligilactobacillus ubinensis]MCP0886570.1 ABC transporter ATP-binding protein [Ligilactobacillus ubinensis]